MLPTRPLPKQRLRLSTIGLGTAPLGGNLRRVSDTQAVQTVLAAWEGGIRYFDTAPYYGYGASEHRVGAALREIGAERVAGRVISTKVGRLLRPRTVPQAPDDAWIEPLPFEPVYDYSGPAILRSFEDSQQRLGTGHIDILLVHDIGALTHGERDAHYWRQLTEGGGIAMLRELRASGRVAAIGLGVNECDAVARMLDVLDIDCVLLAGRYTLLEQQSLDLLERCRREHVGVIIGGPFNSGILAAGPNPADPLATYNYARADEAVVARVREIAAVCTEHQVPLPAAALQFVLAHPAVVSCIPGARDSGELAQIVGWSSRPIPADFWQTLVRNGLIAGAAPLPGRVA